MKTDKTNHLINSLRLKIRKQKGFLRSRVIYDASPFRKLRLINFYRQFIRPGDLCFDLGAHTGNHSLAWLQLGAKVIAVEPQPAFAGFITGRLARFPHKIILETKKPSGLANPGKQILNIASGNPTLSTLSEKWIEVIREFGDRLQWDEELEVEVTTLERLVITYGLPSFCKIDVEGYEENVLSGLSSTLPALSFEFFPTTPDRTANCIGRLVQLGDYRFNCSFRESYKFLSSQWQEGDRMIAGIRDYDQRKSGDIYAVLKDKLPWG